MDATATPRRGPGRPATHREKLLAAAVTCLREKGYAGTTARDLVEESGTNLASIGYHFGSKEALLHEAIVLGMDTWTAAVENEVFAEGASGAERIERGLAAMIDRFDELEPYLRSFVEAFPPALRSDELRADMAAAYARVRAAGAGMFRRLLADEGVELDTRRGETLSSLALAVCDGLILQWLLDPGATPTAREAVSAVAAVLPAARG
jgi:AcrR family transcriptional regulator